MVLVPLSFSFKTFTDVKFRGTFKGINKVEIYGSAF